MIEPTKENYLLTPEEILKAFDGDFEPVEFNHKPTPEEVLVIKLRLVAQNQLDKVLAKLRDFFDEKLVEMVAREYSSNPVFRRDCTCKEWTWGWSATCPTCTARRILSLILPILKAKKSHEANTTQENR